MTDATARIPAVNPLPLWNLAHAYCEARAFHVANELDIFSHLDEEKTSEQMAKLLWADLGIAYFSVGRVQQSAKLAE